MSPPMWKNRLNLVKCELLRIFQEFCRLYAVGDLRQFTAKVTPPILQSDSQFFDRKEALSQGPTMLIHNETGEFRNVKIGGK